MSDAVIELQIRVRGVSWRDRLSFARFSLPKLSRARRHALPLQTVAVSEHEPSTSLVDDVVKWTEGCYTGGMPETLDTELSFKPLETVECDVGCSSISVPLNAVIGDGKAVVVLDGLVSGPQRAALLELLRGANSDPTPPPERWDRLTSDGAGLPPSWGLRQTLLRRLETHPPRAVLEVQSQLCALYPEYDIMHMPTFESGTHSRTSFVANAPTYGDCFQWHVDADPMQALPNVVWNQRYGSGYANGEAGKPLFVSLIVYLDAQWDCSWDAETLFTEATRGVGLQVQPRPGRAVLMHQDVLHRVSTPSLLAGRPRYSLVWKLVFVPRDVASKAGHPCEMDDRGLPGGETICRPEWGRPLHIGNGI